MPSCAAALSTAFTVHPSNTAFSPTASASWRRSCSRGLGSSIAPNWSARPERASPSRSVLLAQLVKHERRARGMPALVALRGVGAGDRLGFILDRQDAVADGK